MLPAPERMGDGGVGGAGRAYLRSSQALVPGPCATQTLSEPDLWPPSRRASWLQWTKRAVTTSQLFSALFVLEEIMCRDETSPGVSQVCACVCPPHSRRPGRSWCGRPSLVPITATPLVHAAEASAMACLVVAPKGSHSAGRRGGRDPRSVRPASAGFRRGKPPARVPRMLIRRLRLPYSSYVCGLSAPEFRGVPRFRGRLSNTLAATRSAARMRPSAVARGLRSQLAPVVPRRPRFPLDPQAWFVRRGCTAGAVETSGAPAAPCVTMLEAQCM